MLKVAVSIFTPTGDYGCPPPLLFIWCGAKEKSWASGEGHAEML